MAGRVVVGEGGTFRVVAPNGALVLSAGEYDDGTYGTYMARGDNTGVAIRIGPSGTGGGQMVQMFARASGSPIVMDDIGVDGYLGRPWIPLPVPVSVFATDWPSTNGGSWGAVSRSYCLRQHSHVVVYGSVYADVGTTGQARLTVNGTPVGPVASAPSGGFAALDYQGALPAGEWGDQLVIEVQCQRTSGGGSVYAALTQLYGINST
ncbi:hypothetical protein ACIBSV_12065 [Embleya sp. NPDC050154]|uniref:hypothetical protein n=1 Tax=Embleya sp. NPDC050154 TaxID=3363988 RepID=UPI00378FA3AC